MSRFSAAFACSSSAGVGRGIATAGGTGADGPMTTGAKLPRPPPAPPPGAPPGGAPAGACADAAAKGTMAKRSIRTISRLVMAQSYCHCHAGAEAPALLLGEWCGVQAFRDLDLGAPGIRDVDDAEAGRIGAVANRRIGL